MANREQKSWFFTTDGDTMVQGFWTRFLGLGTSKPTQATFETLLESVPTHADESSKAAKDTGQSLRTKQGLVIVSSDANAKTGNNTPNGSTGGTLVTQPSQLPTTEASSDGSDEIISDLGNFEGDALNITADVSTTTRNKYIAKLSTPFKEWLQDTLDAIILAIADLNGKFIPLAGTASGPSGDPVSGDIQVVDGIRIYNDSNGSIISEYIVGGGSSDYGPPWNNITTKNEAFGLNTLISQSPSNTYITSTDTINSNNTIFRVSTNFIDLVVNSFLASGTAITFAYNEGGNSSAYTMNISGLGIRTGMLGGGLGVGYIKSDLIDTPHTHQLQNKDGILAHLDDVGVYNTVSTTSNDIDYTQKTFTVTSGLAWKSGNIIKAYSTLDPTKFINGKVASYSGTTLVIDVDVIGGSGSGINLWNIIIGNSVEYDSGITSFPLVAFNIGTYAIGNNELTYVRSNGMVHLSFEVEYNGLTGQPYSDVELRLPSFLAPKNGMTFYGSGSVGAQTDGAGAVAFPFVVEATGGSVPPRLWMYDADRGGVIPGGLYRLRGHITYPYNP